MSRILLIFAVVFSILARSAIAASPEKIDIPALSVHDALLNLARQAGISIAIEGVSLDGYRSRPVIGAPSVSSALQIILTSTPYDFELTGDDTVKLVRRPTPDGGAGVGERPFDSDPAAPVDEILVTALKRLDDARRLPVAVSAVDSEILAIWGADELRNVAPRIAGIAFTNLGTSRNKIFVRGLSDGPFADRTQSTVGVYLDETPINLNDTNPDLRLLDLERVEVVRGPQGSLYGGGAIGGLFRMVTAKPDLLDYSGRANMSGEKTQNGGAGASADIMINAPLAEGKVALRGVVYFQQGGGYIDDAGLSRSNVNASEIGGGRAAARIAIDPNWTIDVLFAAQNVSLDGAQYVFANAPALTRTTRRPEPYSDAFRLYGATVNGKLGALSVTSATSYVRRETGSDLDASAALPALLNSPGAEGVFTSADKIGTINHETRISSDDSEKFRWLLGGSFTARNETLHSKLVVDSIEPAATAFFSDRVDEYVESALFGEATYGFSKRWSATLGARIARTTYEVDVLSGGPIQIGEPVIAVNNTRYAVSPKIAVSFQQSPSLLIYGQAANGSRTGGVNVSSPLGALFDNDSDQDTSVFDSDSLWNSELGAKSQFFNGAVDVNMSMFYVLWSNVQTDQFLPSGFSFIANAGTAQNYGFEFEAAIRPIDRLELTAAVFWNSPELKDANPLLGAAAGDALPNIADVSAGLSAMYEMPLTSRWSALLSSDVSYVGRSYLTFQAGVAPPMGDYVVGNLRFSVKRDDLRAGLFFENVSNERGNSFSFGNPFSLSAQPQETPLRPRTIGIFIQKEF